MNKLVFTCILLLNISQVFAQNKSEPIEIRKGFLGRDYYNLKGRRWQTPSPEIFRIVSTNEAAFKEVQIARKNFYPMLLTATSGSTILVIGLFEGWINLVGISKPEIQNVPLLIILGAGLIGISIPLGKSYSKHLKNAVIIYNDRLKNKELNNIDIKIGMINNGVGLKITF